MTGAIRPFQVAFVAFVLLVGYFGLNGPLRQYLFCESISNSQCKHWKGCDLVSLTIILTRNCTQLQFMLNFGFTKDSLEESQTDLS